MILQALVCAIALAGAAAPDSKSARAYVDAVHELNEKHARDPGKETEEELAKKLPPAAAKALESLLAEKPSDALTRALLECSDAALDLDRLADFQKIRARLAKDKPADAAKLDTMLSRPRFVLRGVGGLDEEYLKDFAEILDDILGAYDELFGFAEFSKVPGKKLRVRLHLEQKLERPPHFAPEFPYHSEIDFPVVDAKRLRSPDAEGHFFFYGLCHELGHVIAMWGSPDDEQDHHAWAHYCGVAIVEHLATKKGAPAWLNDLRDFKWRSLAKAREEVGKSKPGLETREDVLALLLALHDQVGPKAIGAAINALDAEDKRTRINRVRYYKFEELKKALLVVVAKDKDKKKAVEELLP
jgi:hypothetical protein